jgi:hypothetical protein
MSEKLTKNPHSSLSARRNDLPNKTDVKALTRLTTDRDFPKKKLKQPKVTSMTVYLTERTIECKWLARRMLTHKLDVSCQKTKPL